MGLSTFTVILAYSEIKETKVDSGRHSKRVLIFLSLIGKKVNLP